MKIICRIRAQELLKITFEFWEVPNNIRPQLIPPITDEIGRRFFLMLLLILFEILFSKYFFFTFYNIFIALFLNSSNLNITV